MELNKIFKLNKESIISIVGAGGKSTLMNFLAKELKKENKVLVTTTTKIYKPKNNDFDFIALGRDELNILKYSSLKGIYVYGSFINKENKLVGITSEEVESEIKYFDYIIVESDGSKCRSIKGWNSTEPVVCNKSTKTIGVMSIDILGKEINDCNVHRVKEFNEITNGSIGDKINREIFLSVIFHKDGLFKKARGENILFINKIDSKEDYENSIDLLKDILYENNKKKIIHKIVYGSLKNNSFEVLK